MEQAGKKLNLASHIVSGKNILGPGYYTAAYFFITYRRYRRAFRRRF